MPANLGAKGAKGALSWTEIYVTMQVVHTHVQYRKAND